MRKQVLRGRVICRNDLLNRERNLQEKTQVTFNLTCYLIFKNVKKTPYTFTYTSKAHKKVLSEVPNIIFKNPTSLKHHSVRAVLPQLDKESRSKPCEGASLSCEVCESVKDTTKFKKAESEETFDIVKGPLDCNSNNVIHFFECKKCQFKFPYVGSTVTKFRLRFNNYKITHREFRKKLKKRIIKGIKKSELKQKLFHEHYCSNGHEGIVNWCVTLIEQVEDKKELRKKELYWINKLNTWAPIGPNVKEVYEAY